MKKQVITFSVIVVAALSFPANAQPLYTPSATVGSSTGSPNTNVGIGTSTPSTYLAGTNGATLFGANPGLAFSTSSKTWLLWGAAADNSFRLFEKGPDLDRITVRPGGNLGIGTTTPLSKLEVEAGSSLAGNTNMVYVGGQTTSSFGTSTIISNRNTAGWAGIFLSESASGIGSTPGGLMRYNTAHATKPGEVSLLSAAYLAFNTGPALTEKMRIAANGKVGINTIDPFFMLHVKGNENMNWLAAFDNTSTNGHKIYMCHDDGTNQFGFRMLGGNGSATTKDLEVGIYNNLVVQGDGKVGVGTRDPIALLNIQGGAANWSETTPGISVGTVHLDPKVSTDSYGNAITFGASDYGNGETAQAGIYVRSDATYGTKMYFGTTDSYASGSKMRMMIDNLGRVGIGTSYIPTGYLLAVSGKVIAEEFLIKLRQNWPDYVFKKGYKLKTLEEVEEYIKSNQHLPGVPSAKEIEQSGVSLGDMSVKQMEKIEEITLYMIEMNNQLTELNAKVTQLQAENAQLKANIKK